MNDQDIIRLLGLDEPLSVGDDDVSLDLGEAPPLVLLRLDDVLGLLTVSRSTLYAMLDPAGPYHDRELPRPIKIGSRSVAWYEHEIHNYIRTRPRG